MSEMRDIGPFQDAAQAQSQANGVGVPGTAVAAMDVTTALVDLQSVLQAGQVGTTDYERDVMRQIGETAGPLALTVIGGMLMRAAKLGRQGAFANGEIVPADDDLTQIAVHADRAHPLGVYAWCVTCNAVENGSAGFAHGATGLAELNAAAVEHLSGTQHRQSLTGAA